MTTTVLVVIIVGAYLLITVPLVIFPCILASRQNNGRYEKWEGTSLPAVDDPATDGIVFVLNKADILEELMRDGEIAVQH